MRRTLSEPSAHWSSIIVCGLQNKPMAKWKAPKSS
jgi:hypothetical protein